MQECTKNLLRLLEAAERTDIPVYEGANRPMLRTPNIAHFVHGADAFGGIGWPEPEAKPQQGRAATELVERIMASPREITLIALGPLTNIALALMLEPRIAQSLAGLYLMGGAVFTHGNSSEVASANLYNDPEAAAIVYQSGAPIVQVGLDVCRKLWVDGDSLRRIWAANTPTTRLLKAITPTLMAFEQSAHGYLSGEGVYYNDLPAIGYAIQPELFTSEQYYVRISVHDELTRGQTLVDVGRLRDAQPNASVLLDVRTREMLHLFVSRLSNK